MTTIKKRFDVNLAAKLGEGAFGEVVKGIDCETKREVAVKIINIASCSAEAIERECDVMRSLKHDSIIELLDMHIEGSKAYVVMDLVTGQELFDRVTLNEMPAGHLSEADARPLFLELAQAVAFCHSQGVAHRDLKLENVLLGENGRLKLIDFGLAAKIEPGKCKNSGEWDDSGWSEVCGTRTYAAPEVLRGGNGYGCFSADVWSLGVCLFAMCAGFFPFDEATQRDWRFARLKFLLREGNSASHAIFEFYGKKCEWSPQLVELVNSMLVPDACKRAKLPAILASAWFTAADVGDSGASKAGTASGVKRLGTDVHGGWAPTVLVGDDEDVDMEEDDDQPRYMRAISSSKEDLDDEELEESIVVFRGSGLTQTKDAPALRRMRAFRFQGSPVQVGRSSPLAVPEAR